MNENQILLKITIAVIATHLTLLGWSAYSNPTTLEYKPTNKLVVKTIQLNQEKQVAEAPPAPTPPAPKPKPKPKPKPEPKKEPKPDPKPKIDQALLEKAKESIAKLHQNKNKKTTTGTKVPGKIEQLDIDTISNDGAYEAELAAKLRLFLRLPEFGAVTIKLTLEQSGKVIKVETIETKNENNKKYVEKTVPTLKLPSFGNSLGKAKQYTFLITLKNES